jgi:hypothetical protein
MKAKKGRKSVFFQAIFYYATLDRLPYRLLSACFGALYGFEVYNKSGAVSDGWKRRKRKSANTAMSG